jgi:hypothetical protein
MRLFLLCPAASRPEGTEDSTGYITGSIEPRFGAGLFFFDRSRPVNGLIDGLRFAVIFNGSAPVYPCVD